MRMGQGVRTGLGHGASPVSYRHNYLVSQHMLQQERNSSTKNDIYNKKVQGFICFLHL